MTPLPKPGRAARLRQNVKKALFSVIHISAISIILTTFA